MNTAWICTDEDENQWGRQLDNHTFEFKQDVKLPNDKSFTKVSNEINLNHYTIDEIENCINSYGYTLHPLSDGKYMCIYEQSTNYKFLIAEMLFEYELLENL